MDYEIFFNELDLKLNEYFRGYSDFICCKIGCSTCCEKGDYPLSEIELQYMMRGYIELESELKRKVQGNIKIMTRGGRCPFLIDKKCSIYRYRPIICRVHGLAYICKENTVKVPYCVRENKNFAAVYKDGEITINPIKENLDTAEILKSFNYGEIRNLYDWLNHSPDFTRTDS